MPVSLSKTPATAGPNSFLEIPDLYNRSSSSLTAPRKFILLLICSEVNLPY
ncbi:hypothetical protein [Clostridium sporogenes]|uniref:hypothetical protein n=1 Tax=Clostridium sporogenes TaxID=1509 RepID=UPI002155904C|nr:hypothetical protein [Clostridium sporogenes]